jgi:hypothetical protein
MTLIVITTAESHGSAAFVFVGDSAAIPKPRHQRHGLWTRLSARAGFEALRRLSMTWKGFQWIFSPSLFAVDQVPGIQLGSIRGVFLAV